MKISRLMVRGYQQFEDLDLDLTDPATGKPLERVCFLGSNGTGKTTLLRLLRNALAVRGNIGAAGGLYVGFQDAHGSPLATTLGRATAWLSGSAAQPNSELLDRVASGEFPGPTRRDAPLLVAGHDFSVSVTADASMTLTTDPPTTTLDVALKMGRQHPREYEVGPHTADAFWGYLTAAIARRRDRYLAFLDRPENSARTQGELKSEFDRANPEFLPVLAGLWNRLLKPAGLELDLEGAAVPVQLTDSLALRVRVARTKEPLPYNALSSGMRSFLFRLGYLKTLFFELPAGSSFVLVDEPEASLHPDFLYDIVDVYESVCVGSQLFFATHSPIVAAQFRPEERVILEFDENRFVKARRGVAPEGDDPNDVLRSDFHVRSILGKEGVKKWERFLELDELMRRETDAARREQYRREYMEIGAAYHFEPRTDA